MIRRLQRTLVIAAVLAAAGCATAPPPSAPVLQGEDLYLVDPRIGSSSPVQPSIERRFETAWQAFEAADPAARVLVDQLRAKAPDYAPADLALAAIDIREGRLDQARAIVDRLTTKIPNYTAAHIYDAELSVREQNLRRAYDIYRQISTQVALPDAVKDRPLEIRHRLLASILSQASADPAGAVPLLREALTIDPGSRATRMLLVHDLLAQKEWDAARSAVDPLLRNDADKTDVQQVLAEIELGRGHYEQAIGRYERLTKREHDPQLAARLDQLKEEWSAANMPPQYSRAFESEAINRGDLAVLLYWKVPAIRFAQNLADASDRGRRRRRDRA